MLLTIYVLAAWSMLGTLMTPEMKVFPVNSVVQLDAGCLESGFATEDFAEYCLGCVESCLG